MDRHQITGLILMLVLVTVYFQFFAPEPPEPIASEDPIAQLDSTAQFDQPTQPVVEPTIDDSTRRALSVLKFGSFSSAANGSPTTLTVETSKLKVSFSNQGGFPEEVTLKDYTSYDNSPLVLMAKGKSLLDIGFKHLGKNIQFRDLYFESDTRRMGDSTLVTFALKTDGGASIKQLYTLYEDSYEIGYRIISDGMEKSIDVQNLLLTWDHKTNRVEPHLRDPRERSTVRYMIPGTGVDYLKAISMELEEETFEQQVSWVAFKQKYFTSAIYAQNNFEKGMVSSVVNELDTTSIKYMYLSTEIPFTDLASGDTNFKFYFGPNEYDELDAFAEGFNENLNLGWFILSLVNKFLILPIWGLLESFVGSYPVLIIILVVIIRLILSPLTYKSHISMAKMRVMKPELDALKEQNDGDMQKAQQEQMALYQKVGINPLSGCFPMLLQLPILIALFYYIPNAIELRQVSFLWADDLSTYDSILDFGFDIWMYGDHVSLFTLLMTGSTLLFTFFNSQTTTVQGPMKSLQYVMPVMLMFFFNRYAAGLTYYYFISNLVSLGQIFLFRKIIDEGKIKQTLEDNRKKNANKKKSKFQQRLEEAMKANEESRKKEKKKK